MLNWLMDWRLKRHSIAHDKELKDMLEVISKHEMKAHKYFPGVGQRDDVELSTALDWFAANGFVVTDKNGGIVGKVATANMDRSEIAELRRSQMKLVEPESGSEDK